MKNRSTVAVAIGAGLLLFWFVTFVVEWHIRTGWKQYWADGAIRAWANFAMLEWFDTTFATGILAVVAASTVFISAHIDRRARWREMQVLKMADILNLIGQTQLVLRRAAHELANTQRTERFETLLGEAETLCQQFTSDVRPVAHIVMFAISRVKETAFQLGPQIDTRREPMQRMRTLLWGAIMSIEDPERLFERGTGRYVPNKYVLNRSEREVFVTTSLTDSDRHRFAEWLDWET